MRIYYEDTDSGGVVYYANYLKFMERARSEWLRAMGYEQDALAKQGILFAVRSAAVQYVQPARFNELLQVSAAVTHLGRASITFEHRVSRAVRDAEPLVLTSGQVSVVCLRVDTFKPTPIPSKLRQDLQRAG